VRLSYPPSAWPELLVRVLEDVIYLLEVRQVVPIGAAFSGTPDRGLQGEYRVVSAALGRPIGSIPKAITRHRLRFDHDDHAWRCAVTVDV
jgi:SHS2 domain-containing protein